jgi:spore coat protein U-like protein
MQDKRPHYTTLQKFSARSRVLAIAAAMIRTIGRAAGEPKLAKTSAAMAATGMATTTASAHFQSRAGRTRRKWVKVSAIVLCGSLLPLSPVMDWGSGHDKSPAQELMAKASQATLPAKLYADAGYDAEWVHDQCRLDWGAESVIKPARQRADGTRSGFWRSRMSEKYLERKGYGARWAVESFFSALKRTMGSTLTSRKPSQLLAEAAFKVLAHTLRR